MNEMNDLQIEDRQPPFAALRPPQDAKTRERYFARLRAGGRIGLNIALLLSVSGLILLTGSIGGWLLCVVILVCWFLLAR